MGARVAVLWGSIELRHCIRVVRILLGGLGGGAPQNKSEGLGVWRAAAPQKGSLGSFELPPKVQPGTWYGDISHLRQFGFDFDDLLGHDIRWSGRVRQEDPL